MDEMRKLRDSIPLAPCCYPREPRAKIDNMARVKIEEIIEHLSSEMQGALSDALSEVAPDADVNKEHFFRAFKKAVYRRCNTWENVPDQYVESR
jgi:hypothetical protein